MISSGKKYAEKAKMTGKRRSRGVTLIELMVVIVIIVIVMVAVGAFQRNVFTLNRVFYSTMASQSEARRVFKDISSEVRSISAVSEAGSYSLETAEADEFAFFRDADGDGLAERIRYFRDGDTLKKGIIVPSGDPAEYNLVDEEISTVIHDVTNDTQPLFEYYDSSYSGSATPLPQPLDISEPRLIKITVKIGGEESSAAPLTLTTQITMRNLKDNL